MTDILQQIREDMEAGTPGPWFVDQNRYPTDGYYISSTETFDFDTLKPHQTVALTTNIYGPDTCQVWPGKQAANARRIARVPEMEQTILEQAAEIERLREPLERIVKDADLEELDQGCLEPVSGKAGWDCWIAMARAALQQKERD